MALPVVLVARKSLWTKHFNDPSQCWHNKDTKRFPGYPDFRHKITEESAWSNRLEHGRRGLKVRNEEQLLLVTNHGSSTVVTLLNACAKQKDLDKGSKLHAYIRENELLEKNCYVGSALISMYARCGALAKAQEVFNELPVRDVVVWTALIAAYAGQGHGSEALKHFDNMQREGHSPNAITFICALKACGNIGASAKGKQIHDKAASLGMLEKDIVLGSTVVDMYARCGDLAKAQTVFYELPARDVVAWTALITGYAKQGQGMKALKCFDRMQFEGHSPDAVTFICALKACGSTGTVARGKQIHDKIVSLGMLEKDIVLGSTLVDMYARCGALKKAQQVLKGLPVRNVVAWTSLMAGYVQQGQGEEALRCFDCMQHEGHSPDLAAFTCALKACGTLGSVMRGKQIHEKIVSLGMLEKDIALRSTLVDMYIRCGAFAKAHEAFHELPVQDVVAWTALVAGYTQEGQGEEALNCFEKMLSKGIRPDQATVGCVLTACGHSGLLDQAEFYFWRMSAKHGISPDLQHYCCMVDLFGRAGRLDKALVCIGKMSSVDYLPYWLALMGACHKWGDMKIGRLAFEQVVSLDYNHAAAYVSMASIFTVASLQKDVYKTDLQKDVYKTDVLVD